MMQRRHHSLISWRTFARVQCLLAQLRQLLVPRLEAVAMVVMDLLQRLRPAPVAPLRLTGPATVVVPQQLPVAMAATLPPSQQRRLAAMVVMALRRVALRLVATAALRLVATAALRLVATAALRLVATAALRLVATAALRLVAMAALRLVATAACQQRSHRQRAATLVLRQEGTVPTVHHLLHPHRLCTNPSVAARPLRQQQRRQRHQFSRHLHQQ
jgi:hypothetical protein